MNFTINQFTAMLKHAIILGGADGQLTKDEESTIWYELLTKCNLSETYSVFILEKANKMEDNESFALISQLSLEQKKYFVGFMTKVMKSDGRIDKTELIHIALNTMLSNLPQMSVDDAISFWEENNIQLVTK